MNTKKIALVTFLIGLIVLSVGSMVVFSRWQSPKNNLRTELLVEPRVVDDKVNNNPAVKPVAPVKTEKVFTETQINQKIQDKKQEITIESKDRPLTDEEMYFLSFPREAAIGELKKQ